MFNLLCIDHLGNEVIELIEAMSLSEAIQIAKLCYGYESVKLCERATQ